MLQLGLSAKATCSLMAAAVALRFEPQPTVGMQTAGEGPLVGVDPHVGLHVAPITAHFEAYVALKVNLKTGSREDG